MRRKGGEKRWGGVKGAEPRMETGCRDEAKFLPCPPSALDPGALLLSVVMPDWQGHSRDFSLAGFSSP